MNLHWANYWEEEDTDFNTTYYKHTSAEEKQKEVEQNKNIRDGLALHNAKFTIISAYIEEKLRIELA